MPATLPLSVYRADATQIVVSVFTTMLNLDMEPTEASWTTAADRLTAAIYFTGTWKGAVLLECTRRQAFEFTHRLMSIELPTCVNDDVRDAMGELANMLAGNLKSVVPNGLNLSMPSVVEGGDYTLRISGGNLVDHIPFLSPVGLIWVTLIEMVEQARG